MSLVPQNITSLAEDDIIGAGKNIVAGASVSITKSGGGMASIYSDAAGTTPISLPTVTDSSGELLFYIESGSYIYTIAGAPYPVFVSDKNQVIPVDTFAALATTAATTAGMVVYVKQHTSGGVGGGHFQDTAGTITNDGGTLINNTVTAGRHWSRIDTEMLSIDDFGASPSSTSQTDAALTAIMASAFKYFYVPAALYTTTKAFFNLTKTFYGPGQINTVSDSLPGNYTYVATRPIFPAGGGLPYDFQGDLSKTEPKYYILGPETRTGLSENYFQSQTTPEYTVLDTRDGNTGVLCKFSVAASAGVSTITVNSTDGVANGMLLRFSDALDNYDPDIKTVLSFTSNTITFTSPLLNPHDINDRVANSNRTSNQFTLSIVVARGGGDTYDKIFRMEAAYTPKAGQNHFYYTSTVGAWGGDTVASTAGNYLQVSEYQINDNGFDSAAIGDVRTFFRNNNTGARSAVWVGTLYASAGTKPAEACHVVSGGWRRGIDLCKGDYTFLGTVAKGPAINMSSTQAIYWNSTVTSDDEGQSFYGNVLGNILTYAESGHWKISNNGNIWLFSNSGTLFSPGSISCGADVLIPTNSKINLNSASTNTYLTFNGTNILLVKAGVTVATW